MVTYKMSEASGFFESEMDSAQQYDREYYASQFAKYFSLFIGNGVFANPTDQLKVVPATLGLSVNVKAGYAFINGYWYENSTSKQLNFSGNYGSANRIDCVKARFNIVTRSITVDYYEDTTAINRTDDIYDLKLAEITVPPNASSLTDANIKDTRANEDVCGFVANMIQILDTKDLFSQYDKIFQDWFVNIQNQLDGDVAANLQKQIGTISTLKTTKKDNLVNAVNEIHDGYLPKAGGTIETTAYPLLTLKRLIADRAAGFGFKNINKDLGALMFDSNQNFIVTLNIPDGTKDQTLKIQPDGYATIFGDEIIKKSVHRLKTYDTLARIGLDETSTLNDILKGIANGIMSLEIGNSNRETLYNMGTIPTKAENGILFISANSYRGFLLYVGEESRNIWFNSYRGLGIDNPVTVLGWRKYNYVTFATTEPTTVAEGEIVMVYEA